MEHREHAEKSAITTLAGSAPSALGLAAHPEQDRRCLREAFERGINFFFFYGPGHATFAEQLASLARDHRSQIVVATGSGARTRAGLMAARRKILGALGIPLIDVFFAEYIHPQDNPLAVFGNGGVLDELQRWKGEGRIRLVGATAHDRQLARRLAEDERVDVLMHRFNMAHRKAASDVFPAAMQARTPIVAFTATRWATLLKPYPGWPDDPPTGPECYRYCLSFPAVQLVLSAPKSMDELAQNLAVLESLPMGDAERAHWDRYGDLVYGEGTDRFETYWP